MRLILALVLLAACVESPVADEAQRHSADPVIIVANPADEAPDETPGEDTADPERASSEALQEVDERIQTLRNEIASDRRL